MYAAHVSRALAHRSLVTRFVRPRLLARSRQIHYAYISISYRLFSSSLGTPDPPEHAKAGERHEVESSTGSLGVKGDADGVAGERSPVKDDKDDHKHEKEQHGDEHSASAPSTVSISEREAAAAGVLGSAMGAGVAAVMPAQAPLPPPSSLLDNPFPQKPSTSSTAVDDPQSPMTAAAPSSLSSPAPTNKNLTSSFILPPVSPSSPLIRGVLWFDCVFPMQVHRLDPRHLFATHNHETLIPSVMPKDIDIVSMIPRIKEGGVFVHFETRKNDQWSNASEMAQAVIRRLTAKPVRARLTTRPVHCHLVKGDPFIEDLLTRFPASRLKIEIKGSATALSEVTLEHLFGELRAFGRINDLVLSPWVKDQPRQASVQYRRMHGAVGARNCLHRFHVMIGMMPATLGAPVTTSPVTLYLSYDSMLKTSVVMDWAQKHPRLIVPLIGLLFAAFTFLIFDPLRSFNITNKITGRFKIGNLTHRGPLPWIRDAVRGFFNHRIFDVFRHQGNDDPISRSTWSAREADQEKVDKWLASIPDRILFLTGPKGSGKAALVKKVTADRPNVLSINFGTFIDRNDEEFVKGLSQAVGFSPGFSLLTWISSIMDIFTPGAGKAAGAGSAQYSAQVSKILEIMTDSLASIDEKSSKRVKSVKDEKDGNLVIEEHRETSHPKRTHDTSTPTDSQKDRKIDDGDSDSESHGSVSIAAAQRKAAAVAKTGANISDTIPLFIVDGFSPDNKDKHSGFMASFVDWAAAMTSAQLARFLFLTDSTLEESVSKSMPDIKIQEVSLSDADTASAFEFVLNSVKDDLTDDRRQEIQHSVEILGGRFSDLLSLVRQLESGANPLDAAEEIVNQAQSIVKNLIFSEGKEQKWNKVQLWQTVGMLVRVADESQKRGIVDQESSSLHEAVLTAPSENLVAAPTGTSSNDSDPKATAGTTSNVSTSNASDSNSGSKAAKNEKTVSTFAADAPTGHVSPSRHSKPVTYRDYVGYDDLLFNIFQGDDAALKGLVRADLLRIESRLHEQDRVRAGSPVTLEAMKRLVHDPKFSAGLDAAVAKSIIATEQKKINEFEDELARLNRLEADYVDSTHKAETLWDDTNSDKHAKRSWLKPWTWHHPPESISEQERRVYRGSITSRRQYLLAVMYDSHAKLDKYDQQRRQSESIIKKIDL